MTLSEKRSNERISYQGQAMGSLFLRTAERRITVERIVDVSSNGIRVALKAPLRENTKVALEYVDGPIQIEVFGTVAHMGGPDDSAPPGGAEPYWVGIALMNPMTLIAMIQAGNQNTQAGRLS